MSLRIAFSGGPLAGTVMTAAEDAPTHNIWMELPRYVFRATRHGRVGASFDVFHPADLPSAMLSGGLLQLHEYRITQRFIADDATILIKVEYVSATGRTIKPASEAISEFVALQRLPCIWSPSRPVAYRSVA